MTTRDKLQSFLEGTQKRMAAQAEKHLLPLWDSAKKRVRAQARNLKDWSRATAKNQATEIKKVIGPEKTKSLKEPDRPFGKEGGEDVTRVVWTGHKIATHEGQTYYGAVGLTGDGYYRVAEVQTYGAEEKWRWQAQRHVEPKDAVKDAKALPARRLKRQPKWHTKVALSKYPLKERKKMADKPITDMSEAAKAQLEATRKQLQAQVAQIPVDAKAANTAPMREGAERAQEKIAQMARDGQDASAISKAASKDDFRR